MPKVEAPRPHTMSMQARSTKARYEANVQNAQKSTGPKTAKGKRNSSLNGFKKKHMAATSNIETAETTQIRADRLDVQFVPKTAHQRHLRDQLAITEGRIHRSQIAELRLVEDAAIRAREFWDLDRGAEIAELGSKILREPDRVVQEMKKSRQGCEWLIARWRRVADKVKFATQGPNPPDPDSPAKPEPDAKVPATDGANVPENTLMFASALLGYFPGEELESHELLQKGFVEAQIRKVEVTLRRHVRDDLRKRILVKTGQDERPIKGLSSTRRHELSLIRHSRWLAHRIERPTPDDAPLMDNRAQYHRSADDPEQYSDARHTPYNSAGDIDKSYNPAWDYTDFDTPEARAEQAENDQFCRTEEGRSLLLNDKRVATLLTKKREGGVMLSIHERNVLLEALRQMDFAPEDVRDLLELGWLDLDTPDELLAGPIDPVDPSHEPNPTNPPPTDTQTPIS